jgi:predicted metalloprotease
MAKTKGKIKAYTAGEKRIIDNLAYAILAKDVDKNVMEEFLKEHGHTGESFSDYYLRINPEINRTWKALQRAMTKVRKEALAND